MTYLSRPELYDLAKRAMKFDLINFRQAPRVEQGLNVWVSNEDMTVEQLKELVEEMER